MTHTINDVKELLASIRMPVMNLSKNATDAAIESACTKALTGLATFDQIVANEKKQMREAKLPKVVESLTTLQEIAKVLANVAVSTLDALDDESLTDDELEKFKSETANRTSRLLKQITVYKEMKGRRMAQGDKPDKEVLKPSGKRSLPDELYLNAPQVVTHYAQWKRFLPNEGSQQLFVLMQLPVIAMFDPNLSPADLQKGGIQTNTIGQYVVLENQLVIGFNNGLAAQRHLNKADLRKAVIASLESKKNHKFYVVPRETGNSTSGFSYSWVVPASTVNRVMSRTGKDFNVAKWGLAFK